MAETSNRLKQILERIRGDTEQALILLNDTQKTRALAWMCTGCGHVKHFTKAVSFEVVTSCPRCQIRPVCAGSLKPPTSVSLCTGGVNLVTPSPTQTGHMKRSIWHGALAAVSIAFGAIVSPVLAGDEIPKVKGLWLSMDVTNACDLINQNKYFLAGIEGEQAVARVKGGYTLVSKKDTVSPSETLKDPLGTERTVQGMVRFADARLSTPETAPLAGCWVIADQNKKIIYIGMGSKTADKIFNSSDMNGAVSRKNSHKLITFPNWSPSLSQIQTRFLASQFKGGNTQALPGTQSEFMRTKQL